MSSNEELADRLKSQNAKFLSLMDDPVKIESDSPAVITTVLLIKVLVGMASLIFSVVVDIRKHQLDQCSCHHDIFVNSLVIDESCKYHGRS